MPIERPVITRRPGETVEEFRDRKRAENEAAYQKALETLPPPPPPPPPPE